MRNWVSWWKLSRRTRCSTIWSKCKGTLDDVDLAELIYRPNMGSITGKTTWKKPVPVVHDVVEFPTELLFQCFFGPKRLEADFCLFWAFFHPHMVHGRQHLVKSYKMIYFNRLPWKNQSNRRVKSVIPFSIQKDHFNPWLTFSTLWVMLRGKKDDAQTISYPNTPVKVL